ncbi:uracil-xanthine permease family protein [Actinomycetes bacterium M1A6_2h]
MVSTTRPTVDEVDAVPRIRRLVPLALQHVFLSYSGMVTVPLLIGAALGFSAADIALLISANLLVSGIATILQTVGFPGVGARLPIVMGSTFTAITPAILIGEQYGITAVFGATIVSGIATVLLAPSFGKFVHLFPPLVTGTVIAVIGFSLVPSAANLITRDSVDHSTSTGIGLALTAGVVVVIVAIEKFAPASIGRFSVLLGLVIGTAVACVLGMVNLDAFDAIESAAVPNPLAFGWPTFVPAAIVAMLIVQIVNMVESTGDTLAVGDIVGRGNDGATVTKALRADGLATVVAGAFTSFPIVTFGQSVGLVSVTRVLSRWVVLLAGILLAAMAFFPPLGAVAATVPGPVLGAVGFVMFATVGSVGLKILRDADLGHGRNLLIVAVSFGLGIMPVGAPDLYAPLPPILRTVFDSGIAAAGICAFTLNLVFNRPTKAEEHA